MKTYGDDGTMAAWLNSQYASDSGSESHTLSTVCESPLPGHMNHADPPLPAPPGQPPPTHATPPLSYKAPAVIHMPNIPATLNIL